MSSRNILMYIYLVFCWMLSIIDSYCECPCKKHKVELAKAMSKSEENRNYFAPMKIVENQRANILKGSNSNTENTTSKKQNRLIISEIRMRRRIAKFGF